MATLPSERSSELIVYLRTNFMLNRKLRAAAIGLATVCGGCQSLPPVPHTPPSAVSVAVPASDSPEERVRMLAASRLVEQDQQEFVDAAEKPQWKAALRSVNRSATPAMR